MAGQAPELPKVTYTYKTYRLDPKSPNIVFLAGKYAALSLHALTTDPGSFGMTYAIESSWGPADWIKRISRPNVHLFICVAHPSAVSTTALSIENGEWIGMVTQIGPSPKSWFWLPESGSPEPLGDELETKWHQTATWNDPAHRGRGIAKQLIETGVAYAAASITGSVRQARIRAITGPQNEVSKSLYGSRGFPHVGLCTIPEAMEQNGNGDYPFLHPPNGDVDFMSKRMGVLMERVVKKKDVETRENGAI